MFSKMLNFRRLFGLLLLAPLSQVLLRYSYGLFDGYFMSLLIDDAAELAVSRWGVDSVHASWADLVADLSDIATEPYLPKIMFYIRWWERLGLKVIDGEGLALAKLPMSVETYHREVVPAEGGRPWHHWLFLSSLDPMNPENSTVASAWHEALEELVQNHHRHPASNGASFHYVWCALDPRTCIIWQTPGPALVHLTTENSDGSKHQVQRDGVLYEKVFMRVIQLPLSDEWLHLAPGSFPSPLNQLKSLTHSPDEWKRHEPVKDVTHLSILFAKHTHVQTIKDPYIYGNMVWMVRTVLPNLYPWWLFNNPFIIIPSYWTGYLTSIVGRLACNYWIIPSLQRKLGTAPVEPQDLSYEDGSAWRWLGERAEAYLDCVGEDSIESMSAIEGAKPLIQQIRRIISEGKRHINPTDAIEGQIPKGQEETKGCWKLN